MICNECGREILNRARFCPACGATVSHDSGSAAKNNMVLSEIVEEPAFSGGARPDAPDGDTMDTHQKTHGKADKAQRNSRLYYSSIGLFILGIIQFIFFNPLIMSDFSTWDHYAYMRGIPWYICDILPYAMVSCDLLLIIFGIVGALLARRKDAAWFYRASGIITPFISAGMLLTRIVHGFVIFRSVGLDSSNGIQPETVVMLQEKHSRSLYAVFVFAAIAIILSFCNICFSPGAGKQSSYSAGKVMGFIGINGLIGSLCGILFGKNAGDMVPLAAAWALVAFVVMLAAWIAGLSKRRSLSARVIWGFAQLFVFTFCMLQTVYYAYSAIIKDAFFKEGPFIWITVLLCIFAVSIAPSANYTKRKQLNSRLNTASKK